MFRHGDWRGLLPELPRDGEPAPVPFFVALPKSADEGMLVNGKERIPVRVEWEGPKVTIELANAYSSRIVATEQPDGSLEGMWSLENPFWGNLDAPFRAVAVTAPDPTERFDPNEIPNAPPEVDFTGTWRATWSILGEGVAQLEQRSDGVITGFLQPIHFGDSQHLAGVVRGKRAWLSTFDGSNQAALYSLTMTDEGRAEGVEIAAGVWRDEFHLVHDDDYRLPNNVRLTGGAQRLDLPILEKYEGNPTVLLLFATWCPSCMDETRTMVKLYEEYHPAGLEVVALSYDSTPDAERAAEAIEKYRRLFGVDWEIEPVLGTVDEFGSLPPFPQLQGFEALPTTVFVNRDGTVRAIHAGFSGPATGREHERVRAKFERLIRELLEPRETSNTSTSRSEP